MKFCMLSFADDIHVVVNYLRCSETVFEGTFSRLSDSLYHQIADASVYSVRATRSTIYVTLL